MCPQLHIFFTGFISSGYNNRMKSSTGGGKATGGNRDLESKQTDGITECRESCKIHSHISVSAIMSNIFFLFMYRSENERQDYLSL